MTGRVDPLRRTVTSSACQHTPVPSGYVAWHEWAESKARTHRQERCPSCGLWAIWKPVKKADRAVPVGGVR